MSAIAGNYAAAASLILLGYAFYANVLYATEVTRVYYDGVIPGASWADLRMVAAAYLLLLPLYYATFSDDHTVKCRRFWQGLCALPIADQPPRRRSPFGPSQSRRSSGR